MFKGFIETGLMGSNLPYLNFLAAFVPDDQLQLVSHLMRFIAFKSDIFESLEAERTIQ